MCVSLGENRYQGPMHRRLIKIPIIRKIVHVDWVCLRHIKHLSKIFGYILYKNADVQRPFITKFEFLTQRVVLFVLKLINTTWLSLRKDITRQEAHAKLMK